MPCILVLHTNHKSCATDYGSTLLCFMLACLSFGMCEEDIKQPDNTWTGSVLALPAWGAAHIRAEEEGRPGLCCGCRAVMQRLRRQPSGLTGAPAFCWRSNPARPSSRCATCQTRTQVSCGTALRWSADPSRTLPTTCAAWSRKWACKPYPSLRTWLYKRPLPGYAYTP